MKEKNKKNRIITEICLILSLFILSIPIEAQNWEKVNDVTNPYDTEFEYFGNAVAIDGNYAVTKSNVAMFIFERDVTTGKWFEKQVFAINEYPYYTEGCVSISGNYIAIVNGENEETGSVFLYERDTLTNIWSQKQELTPSDAIGFSGAVAIKGNYLIAGAIYEKEDVRGKNPLTNAGAVYVFENISGTWTEQQKLVESNRRESACFGSSVSISDDYIVVGSRGYYVHPETTIPIFSFEVFSGSVSVFKKDKINDYWNNTGYICSDIDLSIIGNVCISDKRIAFGLTKYSETVKPVRYNSSVYIYNLQSNGNWVKQNSFEIFKGESPYTVLRNFTSVCLSGRYLEAQVFGDRNFYIYEYESETWKIKESFENFYSVCAISGENMVIGYKNENDNKGLISFYKVSSYIDISNSAVSIGSSENSTANVNVKCNTSFTVTSNQPWLKVSPQNISQVVGSTVVPLIFTASANPTTVPRTAKITITAKGVNNQFIFVTQKTTTTVTWDNPEDIAYGTPLSATQLNATANVEGTFIYTPSFETILNVGNSQSLEVLFIPSDTSGYESISKTVTINVTKATPEINWKSPDDILLGTALTSKQLNATSNAAGTFIYDPAAGTKLGLGTHDLTVSFTPTDLSCFYPSSKTVQIKVTEPSLSVDPSAFQLERTVNVLIVDITSNISWTATSDQDWITVDPVSGIGNGILTVTTTSNSFTAARTATVTINGPNNLSQTIAITQSGTMTSSNLLINEDDITLYPNPADNCFKISGIVGNATLQISDLNGKVRFFKEVSENEYLSVDFLKEGIYIVKVSSGEGNIIKKLIKK